MVPANSIQDGIHVLVNHRSSHRSGRNQPRIWPGLDFFIIIITCIGLCRVQDAANPMGIGALLVGV